MGFCKGLYEILLDYDDCGDTVTNVNDDRADNGPYLRHNNASVLHIMWWDGICGGCQVCQSSFNKI